jgi:hypothetical protein
MPPRKHGNVATYLSYMKSAAVDILRPHITDPELLVKLNGITGTVYEELFKFYHSSWMLWKMWDASKAQTLALDLAVTAVLKQSGINPSDRRKEGEDQVVFAIGLAKFNMRSRLSSKHGKFLSLLVKKVRAILFFTLAMSPFSLSVFVRMLIFCFALLCCAFFFFFFFFFLFICRSDQWVIWLLGSTNFIQVVNVRDMGATNFFRIPATEASSSLAADSNMTVMCLSRKYCNNLSRIYQGKPETNQV